MPNSGSSCTTLQKANTQLGTFTNTDLKQTISTNTLSNTIALALSNGMLWVVAQHTPNLWKVSESGQAVGWGKLPGSAYSELSYSYYIQSVAMPTEGKLIITTLKDGSPGYSYGTGGTIRNFYIDVSQF